MEVYSYAPWISMPALMAFITAAQSANFSLVEQRNQVSQRLANIITMYPVANNRRFTDTGLFICTVHGDWSRKLQQLRTSLAFKDHSKDPKSRATPTDISDALVSYQNSLTSMLDQMVRMDGVFGRDSFEELTGIVWVP